MGNTPAGWVEQGGAGPGERRKALGLWGRREWGMGSFGSIYWESFVCSSVLQKNQSKTKKRQIKSKTSDQMLKKNGSEKEKNIYKIGRGESGGLGDKVLGQECGGGARCPRGVAVKGDGTRFRQHTRLLIQLVCTCVRVAFLSLTSLQPCWHLCCCVSFI